MCAKKTSIKTRADLREGSGGGCKPSLLKKLDQIICKITENHGNSCIFFTEPLLPFLNIFLIRPRTSKQFMHYIYYFNCFIFEFNPKRASACKSSNYKSKILKSSKFWDILVFFLQQFENCLSINNDTLYM